MVFVIVGPTLNRLEVQVAALPRLLSTVEEARSCVHR